MLIPSIGLLEPIQNQDHRIIPGCSRNPYRFIHTKCPLSHLFTVGLELLHLLHAHPCLIQKRRPALDSH